MLAFGFWLRGGGSFLRLRKCLLLLRRRFVLLTERQQRLLLFFVLVSLLQSNLPLTLRDAHKRASFVGSGPRGTALFFFLFFLRRKTLKVLLRIRKLAFASFPRRRSRSLSLLQLQIRSRRRWRRYRRYRCSRRCQQLLLLHLLFPFCHSRSRLYRRLCRVVVMVVVVQLDFQPQDLLPHVFHLLRIFSPESRKLRAFAVMRDSHHRFRYRRAVGQVSRFFRFASYLFMFVLLVLLLFRERSDRKRNERKTFASKKS